MAFGALMILSAALSLPTGATCSYDAATATVQAQMLSARTVVANAGDGRILVDGRVCATLAADATGSSSRAPSRPRPTRSSSTSDTVAWPIRPPGGARSSSRSRVPAATPWR